MKTIWTGVAVGDRFQSDTLGRGLLVLNITLEILVLLISGFSAALSVGVGRMTL